MRISKRDRWWPGYKRFAATKAADPAVVAWMSTEMQDSNYDSFIASHPIGQYQQTSIWARAKSAAEWSPIRVVFTQNKQVIGAFQILMKGHALPGRIGYVSKGPIIMTAEAPALEFILYQLKKVARMFSIRALMVQPPDQSANLEPLLHHHGLIDNKAGGIVSSTLILDLAAGIEELQKAMTSKKRQAIRQGEKAGLTIREGSESDLDIFYSFMQQTCMRQGVTPNPDRQSLLAFWHEMAPEGILKMFVVEHDGKPISATVIIAFGSTVTLWKTGWNGDHTHSHPNDFLCWEIVKWAKAAGYRYVDFYGIDAKTASAILDGKPDKDITASVSYFKVAFGGKVLRLPSSLVYIPNPLLRLAFSHIYPTLYKLAQASDAFREESGQK